MSESISEIHSYTALATNATANKNPLSGIILRSHKTTNSILYGYVNLFLPHFILTLKI